VRPEVRPEVFSKTPVTLAKRMLDSGTSLDYVAEITDLPLSTLRALQEDAEVVA